ncbi:MAG TPA: hypothetical protein VGQ59_14970 [Cyclobacteriaceae bacterium]|jgi:hypothetical protein|nr:hypothetical protein [Cyclobacteriaceae bacterium]
MEIIDAILAIDPKHGEQFIREAVDYYSNALLGKHRAAVGPAVPKYHFQEISEKFLAWDGRQRAKRFEDIDNQLTQENEELRWPESVYNEDSSVSNPDSIDWQGIDRREEELTSQEE